MTNKKQCNASGRELLRGFQVGWQHHSNLYEHITQSTNASYVQDVPYAVLHLGEHVSSDKLAGGVVGLVTQLLHLLAVDLQVHIQLLHHSNREPHKLKMQIQSK